MPGFCGVVRDLPSNRLDDVVSALAVTMSDLVARSRGFWHGRCSELEDPPDKPGQADNPCTFYKLMDSMCGPRQAGAGNPG